MIPCGIPERLLLKIVSLFMLSGTTVSSKDKTVRTGEGCCCSDDTVVMVLHSLKSKLLN
jgi:hypothetical protein